MRLNSKKENKILIGRAWPYANNSLHLGHLAALISGDYLKRYHKLIGDDIVYVSGTDCRGTPITEKAKKDNVDPKEIVDKYHKEFTDIFNELQFSYDIYTRTDARIYERNYNPLKGRTLGVIIKVKKPATQYNLNLTARVTARPIDSGTSTSDDYVYNKTISVTIPATLPKPAAPKPVASTTTNQSTTVDQPAPQQQKPKTETPKKVNEETITGVPKVNEETITGDTNNLNQEKVKARNLYIVIGALSAIIVLGGATSGYFIYKAKKPSVDA